MKINTSGWAFITLYVILFIQFFTDIPIIAYFFGLILILIFGFLILDKLELYPSFKNKLSKEQIIKTKNQLKIDDKQWRKLSRNWQKELYDYCYRQENVKNRIVSAKYKDDENKIKDISELLKFVENKKNYIINFRKEIDKEWDNYSLEKRIETIHIEEKRILEEEGKREVIRENERLNYEKRKLEEENEKRINDEKNRLIKLEQDKKNAEEQAKREQIEKEERQKLEQIRKQEQLEERRKQNEIAYKERIKKELLEKERKKHLESEAIQELIDLGMLSDNFSIQNKREPIPSHIKEAVWKRDKGSCVSCGSQERLEFDHNIPVSKGGSNTINNIQILCQNCNRSKSSKIM